MTGLLSYELFIAKTSGGNSWFTPEGGLYEMFINDTGSSSVKGTIVYVSPLFDNAVSIAPPQTSAAIGVIYEDGVPKGSMVKVVVSGKAQVLLKDNNASVRGYWCGVSDVPGRMYQLAYPADFYEHFRQIGYSLEQKSGGEDLLSLVQLIFN
ncbi:MAG TPA: hypothetical protein VJ903_04525 [Clostridia bacterium]|nr:hypothetical protein [Clostridia bacterium]